MSKYKQLEDENLIRFVKDNITRRAKKLLGININMFGFGNEVEIESKNYSILVECYLQAKSLAGGGDIVGMVDIRPIKQ